VTIFYDELILFIFDHIYLTHSWYYNNSKITFSELCLKYNTFFKYDMFTKDWKRDEPHTIEFNNRNRSVENFAARTLH